MFTRVLTNFSLTKEHHFQLMKGRDVSFAASRKRPVLYVCNNICDAQQILEVNLLTGNSKKIIDLPYGSEFEIACDIDDNIYVYRRCGPVVPAQYYRYQYDNGKWQEELLSGRQKSEYIHSLFSSPQHKCSTKEDGPDSPNRHPYILDGYFYHYDGKQWEKYKFVGTLYQGNYAVWILPYSTGGYLVLCNRPFSAISYLYLARDRQMIPVCITEYEEPRIIAYSPITKCLYGLKCVDERNVGLYVYRFEVLSLFNECVRVIRRYSELYHNVPPCVKEDVDNPITQRYLEQKAHYVNKNFKPYIDPNNPKRLEEWFDKELRQTSCLI